MKDATGLQSQRSTNCLGDDYMKRLNVTMMCMAVYNSYIDVPDNLTFEEAIDYANGHTGDIPLDKLDYVRDVGTLTKFNCAFDS